VFTKAHHWFLSSASPLSRPFPLRYILILSFHLRLGLLHGLFTLSSPPPKFCMNILSPPIHAISHPLSFHRPNDIWRTVLILKVLSHAIIWNRLYLHPPPSGGRNMIVSDANKTPVMTPVGRFQICIQDSRLPDWNANQMPAMVSVRVRMQKRGAYLHGTERHDVEVSSQNYISEARVWISAPRPKTLGGFRDFI